MAGIANAIRGEKQDYQQFTVSTWWHHDYRWNSDWRRHVFTANRFIGHVVQLGACVSGFHLVLHVPFLPDDPGG